MDQAAPNENMLVWCCNVLRVRPSVHDNYPGVTVKLY